MNLKYVALIVSLIFAGPLLASSDISSCSQFIPDNHEYQVLIKYEVRKNAPIKRFVGITDKNLNELTTAQSEQAAPFVKCVKKKLGEVKKK